MCFDEKTILMVSDCFEISTFRALDLYVTMCHPIKTTVRPIQNFLLHTGLYITVPVAPAEVVDYYRLLVVYYNLFASGLCRMTPDIKKVSHFKLFTDTILL